MRPKPPTNYLAGYPATLVAQIEQLMDQEQLAKVLLQKYPNKHAVRTDKALYDYAMDLKGSYLRKAGKINKVAYDNKLHITQNALGTHTTQSRVQGAKLKSKQEIRVSTMFKDMPPEFLRMIVVHELSHIKEREHNKAFYKLCVYMEPDYHQLEFDVRVYLTYLDRANQPLWLPNG
ncbi:YgjP-like metallopeptidase domain-containing protein [Pseudomonadota bacterium]